MEITIAICTLEQTLAVLLNKAPLRRDRKKIEELVQASNFKKKVHLEEQKTQKKEDLLRQTNRVNDL